MYEDGVTQMKKLQISENFAGNETNVADAIHDFEQNILLVEGNGKFRGKIRIEPSGKAIRPNKIEHFQDESTNDMYFDDLSGGFNQQDIYSSDDDELGGAKQDGEGLIDNSQEKNNNYEDGEYSEVGFDDLSGGFDIYKAFEETDYVFESSGTEEEEEKSGVHFLDLSPGEVFLSGDPSKLQLNHIFKDEFGEEQKPTEWKIRHELDQNSVDHYTELTFATLGFAPLATEEEDFGGFGGFNEFGGGSNYGMFEDNFESEEKQGNEAEPDDGTKDRVIMRLSSLAKQDTIVASEDSFVGIGTRWPSVKLDVNGGVQGTSGYSAASDARYKTNVRKIEGVDALKLINKIRPVWFEWKWWKKTFQDRRFSSEPNQIGFIAQEMERILPQIVRENHDGYKSIQYSSLIPILVSGLEELSNELSMLKDKISSLENLVLNNHD
eukprot:maker-scaffold_3-snap-gene-19.15-mRNA-1 protein AED:0.29 eAED:0.29 QI:0/0.66/0.5/0.75/0.66/0.5/4/518/436